MRSTSVWRKPASLRIPPSASARTAVQIVFIMEEMPPLLSIVSTSSIPLLTFTPLNTTASTSVRAAFCTRTARASPANPEIRIARIAGTFRMLRMTMRTTGISSRMLK